MTVNRTQISSTEAEHPYWYRRGVLLASQRQRTLPVAIRRNWTPYLAAIVLGLAAALLLLIWERT